TNHAQIPVNQPKNTVNNYSQDGAGRYLFNAPTVPVYAPNTFGGPAALEPQHVAGGWENDGELTLAAHTLHAEDSDFGQAGTLYREVYDEAAKARFLDTITGAVSGVKRSDIKERAIQYWTNVDTELGAKLRANLGAGQAESDAEAATKY
ncbi:catalase-related domain-containing protein, partial [Arthrobacter sp. AD-310]